MVLRNEDIEINLIDCKGFSGDKNNDVKMTFKPSFVW